MSLKALYTGDVIARYGSGDVIALYGQNDAFSEWLASNTAKICILVEATHSAGVDYFSNRVYITNTGEAPADTSYIDAIVGQLEISERIDREDISDIFLSNPDGELDDLLTKNYQGYNLKILLGDTTWSRDEFFTVAEGLNKGLRQTGDRLACTFHDSSLALDQTIGNETTPHCYGFVSYCQPVFQSGSTFKVHDGEIYTSNFHLYDKGLILTEGINYTLDSANGEFTMLVDPDGLLGAMCQGVNTGSDIVDMIKNILEEVNVDYDDSQLNTFRAQNIVGPSGYYRDTETTARAIIDEALASIGATYRFSTTGQFQLFQLNAPAATADFTIVEDDIHQHGLNLVNTEPPVKEFIYKHGKNFVVQSVDDFAATTPQSDIDNFSEEYPQSITVTNSLSGVPAAQERTVTVYSLIDDIPASAATAEANRRAALRTTERKIYEVKAFFSDNLIQLGDTISVQYPRFGFDSGVNGVVIGMRKNFTLRNVTYTIWV